MQRKGVLVMGVAVIVGLAAAIGVVVVGTDESADRTAVTAPATASTPLQRERGAREREDPRPTGLADVERAARRFLDGYLALTYGEAGADPSDLRNATPELVAELTRDRGRVTPAQAEQAPELKSVAVYYDGPRRASAVAQIADAATTFAFTFRLEESAEGWVVTGLKAR